MTRIRLIAFSSAIVMAASLAARGHATENGAAAEPIYNGVTNSYFQLVTVRADRPTRWRSARAVAREMVFNGVRGRLAVVDTAEIMAFVRDTFDVTSDTWVGARLFCKPHKLLWESAKIHKRSDYTRWHRRWAGSARRCPDVKYMPVYLTSERQGLFWRASAPSKRVKFALVEFAMRTQ